MNLEQCTLRESGRQYWLKCDINGRPVITHDRSLACVFRNRYEAEGMAIVYRGRHDFEPEALK